MSRDTRQNTHLEGVLVDFMEGAEVGQSFSEDKDDDDEESFVYRQ